MATSNDDLIWGIHPVSEALAEQPQKIHEITVLQPGQGAKIQKIVDLARQHKIKIRFVPQIRIGGNNGRVNHQGVVARMAPVETVSLSDLTRSSLCANKTPLIIALDSIQDPHNLGAIIRSSCAAGAAGIIITKDRAAPLGGTAAKVAAGAMAKLDICQVTNLATSLKKLKDAGYWIYGADGRADKTIYETDFSGPVCLVIGSEGKGLRPLIREQCDVPVKIPMAGPTESLNASVAAGVIIFEIIRQRSLIISK